MDSISSCFGLRKSRAEDREPLLPQYRDDTTLQKELHQKLHSYQMLRALSKGYMPSNEQTIINLRTLLAADILNPDNPDLSDSGRLLVKYSKQFLQSFIEFLQHKNSEDQIQDFVWFLSKSRINVDVEDISATAAKAKQRADTAAAYRSLQTVGSLLLTNSDFRIFLSDLQVLGREVFKDSAITLSDVAKEAGKKIDPSEEQKQSLKKPGADQNGAQPSAQDLENDTTEVSKVVANGAGKLAQKTKEDLEDKLKGAEGETLASRLKQAVVKLRSRNDYSDSVSTLSLLLKRYAMTYSRAVKDTVEIAQEDVNANPETDRALKNFWTFIRSFGDAKDWDELENKFHKVLDHKENDPEFESLMNDAGNSLQALLTDPEFFDHADEKFKELREKAKGVGSDSSLRQDIDDFLGQVQTTFMAVVRDEDIAKMLKLATRIAYILSPAHAYTNTELVRDAINVFIPLLIQAIQYVPIPRLEVATPDVDLLLENLIIEPGKTVNHSSFLPYKLRVETYNDLEIRKARFKTTSKVTSLVTIKIDGLSLRADEIGFWLRAHSGIIRLADEGIASFALDEKGIDIHMDVEIGQNGLEKILTLKDVRVHVHKLNYQMRKSKFSILGWLFKPLLRPVMRKVMEKQMAKAIADAIHSANREALYFRERLRATRISDPQDVRTFVKAVMARYQTEPDPDVYTRVGVEQPGEGVFKGVYAPGSVVKLWNEEAARAGEVVDDYEQGGWRNEIFDVHTRNMT